MQRTSPFRAGLIGLGHQASDKHIPGILASGKVELVAVCDADTTRADGAASRLGVPAYYDYEKLLRAEELDFIVVATPHDVHRQIIEAAAICGVHVLKEKPFATSLKEATRIAEVAKAAGITIMTMVQRRLHPVYQSFWTMREQLGEPFFVDARYHFFIDQPGAGWRGDAGRAGGGCVLDMGYHLIDVIVWFFGLPDYIQCNFSTSAERDRHYDAEDTATIQFSYHSGLHGLLTLSRYYAPKTEAVVVIGPDGQLVLDPTRGVATVLVKGKAAHVVQLPPPPGPSALIDHFCGVLAGESRNIGSPEEHLQHMTFIDACYRKREEPARFWDAALAREKRETHEARARH